MQRHLAEAQNIVGYRPGHGTGPQSGSKHVSMLYQRQEYCTSGGCQGLQLTLGAIPVHPSGEEMKGLRKGLERNCREHQKVLPHQ